MYSGFPNSWVSVFMCFYFLPVWTCWISPCCFLAITFSASEFTFFLFLVNYTLICVEGYFPPQFYGFSFYFLWVLFHLCSFCVPKSSQFSTKCPACQQHFTDQGTIYWPISFSNYFLHFLQYKVYCLASCLGFVTVNSTFDWKNWCTFQKSDLPLTWRTL